MQMRNLIILLSLISLQPVLATTAVFSMPPDPNQQKPYDYESYIDTIAGTTRVAEPNQFLLDYFCLGSSVGNLLKNKSAGVICTKGEEEVIKAYLDIVRSKKPFLKKCIVNEIGLESYLDKSGEMAITQVGLYEYAWLSIFVDTLYNQAQQDFEYFSVCQDWELGVRLFSQLDRSPFLVAKICSNKIRQDICLSIIAVTKKHRPSEEVLVRISQILDSLENKTTNYNDSITIEWAFSYSLLQRLIHNNKPDLEVAKMLSLNMKKEKGYADFEKNRLFIDNYFNLIRNKLNVSDRSLLLREVNKIENENGPSADSFQVCIQEVLTHFSIPLEMDLKSEELINRAKLHLSDL